LSSPDTGARELQEVVELRRRGAPFLVYRDDAAAQRLYALDREGPVTLGRAAEVDVCLGWDPSVSLVHAEVVRLGAHWLIGDDGLSRNGTFVNGQRVTGRRRLRHGDVVRIGRTELAYEETGGGRRGATTVTDAARGSGTITLLFTDLVSSTELIDRLGDEAGDRLLGAHLEMLRDVTREHDGREVKSLGDGLMLAFASALGALACAVGMQQRVRAHREHAGAQPVSLRIGLNTGEAISAGGDYFGKPVVVARRLCDHAGSGQILLSEVVRSLVGTRGGYRFIALGELRLKGLADPITAFAVDWRSHSGREQHPGQPPGQAGV
jgi:class 3 adenylate cyclase